MVKQIKVNNISEEFIIIGYITTYKNGEAILVKFLGGP
jgi:hypothetical protein